jgi:hypothetical protein
MRPLYCPARHPVARTALLLRHLQSGSISLVKLCGSEARGPRGARAATHGKHSSRVGGQAADQAPRARLEPALRKVGMNARTQERTKQSNGDATFNGRGGRPGGLARGASAQWRGKCFQAAGDECGAARV